MILLYNKTWFRLTPSSGEVTDMFAEGYVLDNGDHIISGSEVDMKNKALELFRNRLFCADDITCADDLEVYWTYDFEYEDEMSLLIHMYGDIRTLGGYLILKYYN